MHSVLLNPVMNLSDVAEIEELSQSEVTELNVHVCLPSLNLCL